HDICGKVVAASNQREALILDGLFKRGVKNGLKGLKFLDSVELKEREPFVSAKKALLVPEEGIVDFKSVMRKLLFHIENMGGKIVYNANILDKNSIGFTHDELDNSFDWIVNCTGLYSDKVYEALAKERRQFRIVPFRGDYYELKPEAKALVNHLIYPVPDPNFPFLGVHFTRMIDGRREVGPNAVLAFKREGYKLNDFSAGELLDSVLYKGLSKFIVSNFKFSINEFKSTLFKSVFLEKARKLIPDINESDLVKGSSGVRAQAMSKEGNLIMDFKIEKVGNQVHVLNAPSPGATSSLAIASYIIENYLDD
ncbi:MAG TPA: L-2-hydroxyglutarate oxidase, partial [Balneola sp.]|nr:L-2-hydroxyglutarate oxidase [Balneola sp.]